MPHIIGEGEVGLLFQDCRGARRGTSRSVGSEKVLSLYSTRTQNIWRWVLLRHLTQEIALLRHLTQGYQHVGIFCVR